LREDLAEEHYLANEAAPQTGRSRDIMVGWEQRYPGEAASLVESLQSKTT